MENAEESKNSQSTSSDKQGTDDELTFGQYLRQLRLKKKMTQRALAGRTGYEHRAISEMERGIAPPPHYLDMEDFVQVLAESDDERDRLNAFGRPFTDLEPPSEATLRDIDGPTFADLERVEYQQPGEEGFTSIQDEIKAEIEEIAASPPEEIEHPEPAELSVEELQRPEWPPEPPEPEPEPEPEAMKERLAYFRNLLDSFEGFRLEPLVIPEQILEDPPDFCVIDMPHEVAGRVGLSVQMEWTTERGKKLLSDLFGVEGSTVTLTFRGGAWFFMAVPGTGQVRTTMGATRAPQQPRQPPKERRTSKIFQNIPGGHKGRPRGRELEDPTAGAKEE